MEDASRPAEVESESFWETRAQAALADIAAARTSQQLEEVRVRYLGRRGILTLPLRELGRLPDERRRAAGALGNRARERVEQALTARQAELAARELQGRLTAEAVDVTLPGRRPPLGHPHPLVVVRRDIEAIFGAMGFVVAEGPEVDSEWYNFEALNMPPEHPARDMHDSFYVDARPDPGEPGEGGRLLLRTHTSPVQIRAMRSYGGRLPVRIIAPGRVYRRDDDATHSPMFHQVEGLLVDRGVSFGHLKGVLAEFAKRLYGPEAKIRLRPSYFPFTEPSAEVDVSCVFCRGSGCRTCKGSGWIEILGAGMVHPAVLRAGGYDPEQVSGFAFGLGVERVAMLRYGIDDLRLFFEGDLRVTDQF
jgi:phenylalanyl-tRNA synthetase alpha chain